MSVRMPSAPPMARHRTDAPGGQRSRIPVDPDAAQRAAVPPSATRTFAPLAPTPSGYVPGAPIISTVDLHEGLTRLQAGQTGFEVGGARACQFSGIPTGPAQRPARPAGVAARPEGEPARIDDDRDGRDAVRLHLRDQGPAGRHQGAARAPADPGAQGRDARRRVLREEDASVAPARERARARRARLVAGDGPGRSALHARSSSIVHRILDALRRRPRDLRRAARRAQAFLAEEEKAAEAQHPDDGRGDQPERPPRDRDGRRAGPRSSGASRAIRSRTFLASFLRQHWLGALEHVYLQHGEESEAWTSGGHDARGPRVERAAEAVHRGPQASGRAAAVAAEAAERRGMLSQTLAAARSASGSCRTSSRRMPPR